MQRLILFDIDGTLLTTDGVAARAFRAALEHVFGTSGPSTGYSFAGKTDPQIAGDLLELAGIPRSVHAPRFHEVWSHYAAALEREIVLAPPKVFPGVYPLLHELERRPDAVLGLLTGNLQEGARIKLEAAAIGFDRFAVGAFGSDRAERRELPEVALARAEKRFGHRFEGKTVVIIGDTPLDIACGEHLGVRTLAVATGSYSEEELSRCGPDYLFPSLASTDAVLEAIFGEV